MTALGGTEIVLVTDRDLSQAGKGNVQRIQTLANVLANSGADLRIVARRQYGLLSANREIAVAGDRFLGGDPAQFDSGPFREALLRLDPAPDVAIAEYAWLAPALRGLPQSTARLVDLHDILHSRCAVMRAAGLDPWVECGAKEEAALLADAHGLIAITDLDAELARSYLSGRHQAVSVVTHACVDLQPQPPSAGHTLLFVGSNHAGNLGIAEFVRHCFPPIRARFAQARLEIAGSICDAPELRALPPDAGVTLHGYVGNLVPLYRAAALVVAPIRHGSGLKIKTVEALAHGRTVASLPAGIAGMSAAVEPWICSEDWPSLSLAILALLGDADERHRRERRAVGYVREMHGATAICRQLLEIIQQSRQGFSK